MQLRFAAETAGRRCESVADPRAGILPLVYRL